MNTEKVGARIRPFTAKLDLSLETLAQRTGFETGFLSTIVEDDVYPSDMKDFCRGQIARYKIPTDVAFVDSFPLTASGKVQKYRLQEQSLEHFLEAAAG